ncbi:pleckstrin homology domain-containing family G member 3 isoform X2 [Pygocentrus nattereri]|uniref:pleckstrin homology domain-containing family G member 3 isoform X2 n=1 Tax=Pygocentrus nattereri TaxID=42514 RepID=UPI001890F1D2|nr:pleckstrin homology domain-containing family G member 3 isoform X2 [Pygocentrus nattereri]XP_037393819.1 pleckstrin homology domain-containing family G member 3 isoform X2 [Pygocentrus nattereri]
MPEGSHGAARDVPMGEESPRLSTASVSSSDRASTATLSDCSDFPEGVRPVSVVSTVSSGSGSSRDDIAPAGTALSTEDDLELDLHPSAESSKTQDAKPGRCVQKNNGDGAVNSLIPFASQTMAPNPQLTYLDRVVMEIIETERMYVRDLRSIVEDYLAHIIDTAELPIGPEQVCALFGNIEDIYEFNSELLQALDMCENDPVAIARCFVLKSEYFEIYTQYCTNYPNSVAALTDCMRNKTLAKFFRERQAALKRSLPLGSYLLKPVQRILKYHLLLQEIAKHFDPEEGGYEVVEEAIYTMTGVAWYINDMKRKHEHAVRLQEVQSLLINWKGPDLTTYGELVLEGTFRVHRAKNERTLFLFDRMLLITKRRGEHYVYKTHISCSTLMLIESAKDSLCFSVTHYKHPKQPHTVQARTVEERKLWAHHIKRLILENHQAVIPQKAKEAILEMDSFYPKYRYSPERLKKGVTHQSEDSYGRQGRRQSELTKQMLRNTKAVLKHTDSEEELTAERPPVQATASISSLGSSVGEPEAQKFSLSPSDGEEAPDCPTAKPTLFQQDEEGEENGSDDILMEDDQVADFASSMLAAISCWHYRARALLSAGFTTDDDLIQNNCKKGNVHPARQDECGVNENQYSTKQTSEGISLIPSDGSHGGSTEELHLKYMSDTESTEVEPQDRNILNSLVPVETKEGREDLKEEGDEAVPPQQQDLTPGESSEEEEDIVHETVSSSILPTSVLDKASVIAEHFANNTQRSSLAADEVHSLGCASPRLPSRTGSSLSLTEGHECPYRQGSTSSEQQGPLLTQEADFSFLSPREDSMFDLDRGIHRRRDSTLSKQDQLLIDKIKSYYENAEHQDATFSLKRRESLTYIPSGLVRNSVSRFNSFPNNNNLLVDKVTPALGQVSGLTTETSSVTSSVPEPSLSPTDTFKNHLFTSVSTDSIEYDKARDADLFSSEVDGSVNLQTTETKPENLQQEIFRPSSEMIKVWQEMEREVTRSQQERKAIRSRETPRFRGACTSLSRITQNTSKCTEAQEGDSMMKLEGLSTITEESSTPSPVKGKGKGLGRAVSLNEAVMYRPVPEECRSLRAPVPSIVQLRVEAEGEERTDSQLSENAENAQNKVIHLARKYSQRIKCTNPVVQQRGQDAEMIFVKKNLSSVLEEKTEKDIKGKPNLTLSLTGYDEMIPLDQKTNSTSSNTSSSVRVLSPKRSCSKSPLSPSSAEGFDWPDVSELRSKYTHITHSTSLQMPPAGRSCSVPERMTDCGPRRRSSCSSSLVLSSANAEAPAYRTHSRRDWEGPQVRMHRAGSLDHRLSGLYLSDLQDLQNEMVSSDYYISAQATLPNKKNVVVVEKVSETATQAEGEEPSKEPATVMEMDNVEDHYVQIRSPTSREKISIMAVIDRCRAYQESDDYRQREESASRSEQASKTDRSKEHDKTTSSREQLDEALRNRVDSGKKTDASQQGVVKNLREKFLNLR